MPGVNNFFDVQQEQLISDYLNQLSRLTPQSEMKVEISCVKIRIKAIFDTWLMTMQKSVENNPSLNKWCFCIFTDQYGISTFLQIFGQKVVIRNMRVSSNYFIDSSYCTNELLGAIVSNPLTKRWEIQFEWQNSNPVS